MVLVLAAVLSLAAPAATDCPGPAEKPAPLRCLESGDRQAAAAAARAELRRRDATADDRRFAVELGELALRELYAADDDPEHLCELEALFAEYLATPGAVAAANKHRERAAADRRKNHPQHRCTRAGDASPGSHASTSSPRPSKVTRETAHSAADQTSSIPPPSDSPHRTPSGMHIGGTVLLLASMGFGAGITALAMRRDDLADRARIVADAVVAGGGWTHALERERDHILAVDRRMRSAMVGLAVTSGIAAAVGIGLIVAGAQEHERRRAEVTPYGDAHRAGIMLRGRF